MILPTPLVSVDWLKNNILDPNLLIFDASIKKVTASDHANPTSDMGIKGALFFDLKKSFSDQGSSLPNMLPTATAFTKAAQALGIHKDSKIVVYDKQGIYSSPRVWWMFRAMGHEQVAVLDGGLPEWIRAGGTLTSIEPTFIESGNFEARLQEHWVTNASEILKNTGNKACTILDARSAGRFNGTEPEPRAGLRGGHIPGSFSLPYSEVLEDGKMKPNLALKALFQKYTLLGKQMIFSCGSGITASIIMLAANLAGHKGGSVYDGSWTEWGGDEKYPVEK